MQFATGRPGSLPRGPAAVAAGRAGRRGSRRWLVAMGSVLAMTAMTITAVASPARAAGADVDKQVLDELARDGSARFMVYLNEKAQLSGAAGIASKTARTQHVYQQLTTTATRSQAGLSALLSKRNATFTSFWIANLMVVTGDRSVLDAVAARPEVKKISPVRSVATVKPTQSAGGPAATAAEWGLTNIKAPQVWSEFDRRGEGIVVGSIDSGVDFQHPALVEKYRGNLGGGTFDHNYNWYDATRLCADPSVPCDDNGHGTHTMGTMVGDDGAGNQIGVAPGARWIAARGCETNGCSSEALLAAGQFITAPTDLKGGNPRPELRPDVVNNSWGDKIHDEWFHDTVWAWESAGIMPVFAAGNDGPGCGTVGSPSDYDESYTVGGHDINNNLASFSSRGDGKPDLTAPAVNVRSSVPGGRYLALDGTSMAAPHVAGTVALMWSAAPTLRGNLPQTRRILDDTAHDVDSLGCGGTVDDNNNAGEGRLDAYAAVAAAPRGAYGQITGTVTDDSGAVVASAVVVAGETSTITGSDGSYLLNMATGDYTVTASKYGLGTESVTASVAEGGTAKVDFQLSAQASVTVSGRVLDGSGHGWGLYAKVTVANSPVGNIFTDPFTGAYSVTLPTNGTYKLTAQPIYPGYTIRTVDVVVGTTPVTQDIALTVAADCTAPGYSKTSYLTESFDAGTLPAGWSIVKRGNGAEWAFNDPGGDGNFTGGSGAFADADSDAAGAGTTTDTDLVTPVIDLTGVAAPALSFNSDFNDLGAEDFTDVDVSIDGGTTWTTVYHQVDSRRGPKVETVPLTAAANQSNVKLRFHYFGTFDWWWQIDNVRVYRDACEPVPGGLVAGFTTDGLTGAPVNGVTVTSDDRPAEKAVSAATPDDPNIPDGFYVLFSSLTGAHPFTASRAPFTASTKTVTVVADSTTRADFTLGSSRITITPTSIESYQTLGQTRNYNITVRNTGNAPAEVELFERGGGFDLLAGREGAALQRIKVPGGLSPAQFRPGGPKPLSQPQNQPWAADAWTPIADQPVAATDQAAAYLGGKLYVLGGVVDEVLDKVLIYDPATAAWSEGPVMPTARQKAQVAALNGKLYVFGGWNDEGATLASVDIFDPAGNDWSTFEAENPQPVAAGGVAVFRGKVLLVGGCTDANCTNTARAQLFDPVGGFSDAAPYPHSLAWISCGGIGARGYCAGGLSGTVTYTDGFAYNLDSNSWTPIAAPLEDRWAASAAAAGGRLVIAGGVTDGRSTLTNGTMAYDPVADTWETLPNANVATYRGAGACGFYKVGGLEDGNFLSSSAENLADLGDCVAETQVPWLSEDPQTFTLAPGASRTVKVTLAATPAAGVDQPGDYTAEIAARVNSPYRVESVSVTMHVLPPASWGKISGTVTGEGCGGAVPLRAQLEISLSSNPDISYQVRTRSNGTYELWLPRGRYDVIASRDDWRAQVKRHQVQAGFVEVLNFSLRPFVACPTRTSGV